MATKCHNTATMPYIHTVCHLVSRGPAMIQTASNFELYINKHIIAQIMPPSITQHHTPASTQGHFILM